MRLGIEIQMYIMAKRSFLQRKNGYVDTTFCVPASILGLNEEIGYIDIAERLGIVDWSKVKVDTPVLVRLGDNSWLCRYFADFKNGIVYTWSNGATSWSVTKREHKDAWCYAKLAEV